MPRRERLFFEGGFFHVYNRLGRGEHAFRDEETARFFTERQKGASHAITLLCGGRLRDRMIEVAKAAPNTGARSNDTVIVEQSDDSIRPHPPVVTGSPRSPARRSSSDSDAAQNASSVTRRTPALSAQRPTASGQRPKRMARAVSLWRLFSRSGQKRVHRY
jgi:hypothetical protein